MADRSGIVAFLCTWCAYAGADRAGTAQLTIPEGVLVVRVPCSGAVEPQVILEAFEAGAAAVMVLACHPGECHHIDGNRRALQRHVILSRLLEQCGIDKEYLVFDYVSAGEGERFAALAAELAAKVACSSIQGRE